MTNNEPNQVELDIDNLNKNKCPQETKKALKDIDIKVKQGSTEPDPYDTLKAFILQRSKLIDRKVVVATPPKPVEEGQMTDEEELKLIQQFEDAVTIKPIVKSNIKLLSLTLRNEDGSIKYII